MAVIHRKPTDRATQQRRSRPRRTTAEWLEAGWDVLLEVDEKHFTRAAVAERLGVTEAGIYSHFGDWPTYLHDLVAWWAMERYRSQIDARLANTTEPLERLRAFVDEGIHLDPRGRIMREWGLDDPELADMIHRGDDETVERLRQLLHDAGVPDAQALQRAWAFFAAFVGLRVLSPPRALLDDLDDLLEWVLTPLPT